METNYTIQVLDSMMQGLIASKESHGYSRLKNGLLDDCLGQVFTIDLSQTKTTIGQGDEASDIYSIALKLKPVHLIGRL